MKWISLFLAIIFEITGTTMMKLSSGFTKPLYALGIFICYLGSLSFLTLSLKYFRISIAYAIWSGLGILSIAVIEHFFFNEKIDFIKSVFIVFIVIGVAGLNLSVRH